MTWWHMYASAIPDIIGLGQDLAQERWQTASTKFDYFYSGIYLTHGPQVLHICIKELDQHWFRQWLVACSALSHCLNQCWLIVNWPLVTNSEIQIEIQNISFMKMHLKMSSAKWQIFCPGGVELNTGFQISCILFRLQMINVCIWWSAQI